MPKEEQNPIFTLPAISANPTQMTNRLWPQTQLDPVGELWRFSI
jgi:hypothetical protein